MHEALQQVAGYLNLFIVVEEGATHARMRTFMNRAFSGALIEGLSAQIQQITNDLLDKVQSQGQMDACADFAILLPAYVLCDFLGVARDDRDRIIQWSTDFVDFFNIVPPTWTRRSDSCAAGWNSPTIPRPRWPTGGRIRAPICLARWLPARPRRAG